MDTTSTPHAAADLVPIGEQERIQALDVVRGFALLGIFLMNIEWFNRPIVTMSEGMPAGLTGINWLASWFVYNFVQGKFWTMFSLLFGMGFAVMLARAERTGRSFLRPYLRRIAALALFGAAHHILLWSGDILFSYAVGALALLVVLYGRWKPVVAALVVLVGIGFLPRLSPAWAVAGGLAMASVAALFLRGERRMPFFGRRLPVFAFVLLVLGALVTVAAGLLWFRPQAPMEARLSLVVLGPTLLVLGALAGRYHDPAEARGWRLGATLYLLPFVMMAAFDAAQLAQFRSGSAAQASASAGSVGAGTQPADAQRQARREAERAKSLAEHQEAVRAETQAATRGSYPQFVALRAKKFLARAPQEAGFSLVLIGMFLLGAWFVRAGVMTDPEAHRPLLRRLAWVGLPLGVGLGLVGSSIASTHVPGQQRDGFQLAMGLAMIGNLPACLGYVSVIVLALQGGTAFAKVRFLAPIGRMALTSYLTQSLICALFFYHHGLGRWGMGRAGQVGFVLGVYTLQILFSHWWLRRFRYGPMEWLWRAITYWTWPPMRVQAHPNPGGGLGTAAGLNVVE